ncbi:hypothetical protein MTO96_025847 [Rhipicephalus appendiculatus]
MAATETTTASVVAAPAGSAATPVTLAAPVVVAPAENIVASLNVAPPVVFVVRHFAAPRNVLPGRYVHATMTVTTPMAVAVSAAVADLGCRGRICGGCPHHGCYGFFDCGRTYG